METIEDVPVLLLFVFRFVRLLISGDQAVAIEDAALRMHSRVSAKTEASSRKWRSRNPDYWKAYREKHPDYQADHDRIHILWYSLFIPI